MPGGRPRGAGSVRERYADAHFSVTVYEGARGFRIVTRRAGYRPNEKVASDEAHALACAADIWRMYQRGDLGPNEAPPATLAELIERLGPDGSAARVWSLFARHVGDTRKIRRIWRLDVIGFLDAVEDGRYRHAGRKTAAEQPTSSATCLSYLRTIRAGLNRARKLGWIADDPCEDVTVEHEHSMGAHLPYSQWEAYLTACSDDHAIRSAIALGTGMREGEIANARPEWLRGEIGRPGIWIGPDPETGWSPKWGSSRFVPLSSDVQAWIARARVRWPGSRYLFCHSDGLSQLGNWSRATRLAVAASGVTRVTFHGLRRSAGAHWLELGLSLLEVSRLLGHKTITTTERWYAGVHDTTLLAAMAHVDARHLELAEHERTGDVVPFRRAR